MYRGFEHLVSALFLKDSDLMAMMTVYFDDSGTDERSNIAVAACFVSDVRRWKGFCEEWGATLEEVGILDSGFHTTDYVARVPPFDWGDEKRQIIYTRLIAVINKYALAGRASAVVKSDYDRLVTGKLLEKLGSRHYTFAVQSCLAYLEQWAKSNHLLQPMRYEFDTMTKGSGSGEINSLFEDLLAYDEAKHFGIEPLGWGFSNMRLVLPLQASDILAWEAYRYIRDHQFTGKEARLSFLALVNGGDVRARFFDGSTLPEVVGEITEHYNKVGWDSSPRGGFFAVS